MSATAARSDSSHGSPANHPATGRYRLRLARTRANVEAALRLRFEVFNLELHEGFAESFFTGMHEHEFHHMCERLLVRDEFTGKVVGPTACEAAKSPREVDSASIARGSLISAL
jgi:putative hemolysin